MMYKFPVLINRVGKLVETHFWELIGFLWEFMGIIEINQIQSLQNVFLRYIKRLFYVNSKNCETK